MRSDEAAVGRSHEIFGALRHVFHFGCLKVREENSPRLSGFQGSFFIYTTPPTLLLHGESHSKLIHLFTHPPEFPAELFPSSFLFLFLPAASSSSSPILFSRRTTLTSAVPLDEAGEAGPPPPCTSLTSHSVEVSSIPSRRMRERARHLQLTWKRNNKLDTG